MANQKPVDEIRIGRVKATIWRNGTDEQPRHNVTFSRLYKDGDQWKEYAELRAQRFVGACESSRLRPHAPLPASGRSRTPGGLGGRVLAGNRARARRSRSLRRACSFLPASIECLLVVPFRSQAARRWRRPRATLAPERSARFQRLSLALSYLVLARRPALALVSYSGLWFSLFPW